MNRRLPVAIFIFLLVMMSGVVSACTATGSNGGVKKGAPVPLVRLPATVNVEYGAISDIPPDAKTQTITFVDAISGQAEGFELRTYPNSGQLSLMSWISDRWDPSRLLSLRPCRSVIGDCVVIVDSTAYQLNENPVQPDFPVLAVASQGDRVVVVNRLNGILSQTPNILNLLGVVQE